jgi:hypothetical protein
VLGIEVVPQAIVDARQNAKLNEIENGEFFEGKAEEVLGSVCYRAVNDVVAVVDPPRAGLRTSDGHWFSFLTIHFQNKKPSCRSGESTRSANWCTFRATPPPL